MEPKFLGCRLYETKVTVPIRSVWSAFRSGWQRRHPVSVSGISFSEWSFEHPPVQALLVFLSGGYVVACSPWLLWPSHCQVGAVSLRFPSHRKLPSHLPLPRFPRTAQGSLWKWAPFSPFLCQEFVGYFLLGQHLLPSGNVNICKLLPSSHISWEERADFHVYRNSIFNESALDPDLFCKNEILFYFLSFLFQVLNPIFL